MTHLRAMIVDDEPLARKRIRALLGAHQDVEVIGECSDGRQATEAIGDQRPDLVFLDIQMPGMDGLSVVEAIGADAKTAIIFVTAYNEYAVQAFEVNALDYLLKPFDAERFAVALDRARSHLAGGAARRIDFEQRMLMAIEQLNGRAFVDRIAIKGQGRLYLLEVATIDWIEAAGKHVRLHAGDQEHLLREPMHQLESRLDPMKFTRIHRSTLVNLNSIRSLEATYNGEYRVQMKDGTELILSRGYRAKLRERFGNHL